MTEHPKVLVISGEPFNRMSATGITLSNLFGGWPEDRLFEIYTADLPRASDASWPTWRLSSVNLVGLGGLAGPARSGRPKSHGKPAIDAGMGGGVKVSVRRHMAPWLDLLPYVPPKTLLTQLDAFAPQVIYSMLGNIRLTRLAENLARRYRVSVVPHFMDDWLSTYAVPGRSGATLSSGRVLRDAVSKLMRRAPLGLAIGDTMADEYERRFSRPFHAFMNPVDLQPVTVRDITSAGARMGYVGGLHLSRHLNLLQIADATSRLRAQGLDVSLSVWAPPGDLALYGDALTRAGAQCGSLRPDEVSQAINSVDIAIHVESFGAKEAEYTRLSVSTKIPQYFASGVPVLAYGPIGAASWRYIVDNDCGLGVGSCDADLAAALRGLIRDIASRSRMGANARRLAVERHDAETERARFRACLAQAAETGSAA